MAFRKKENREVFSSCENVVVVRRGTPPNYNYIKNIKEFTELCLTNRKKEAGSEVEILLDKEKPLLNNGYLIKLIGMEGRLLRE